MRALSIISMGAGVQSTTLALLAAHGEVGPMPDCAIFADTGAEPSEVYNHLEWMQSPNLLPFPIVVGNKGDLSRDSLTVRRSKKSGNLYQTALVPMFTLDGDGKRGMLPRQCTSEYKIKVVQSEMRKRLGLKRVRPGSGILVECWIGISTDEAHRMKPSQVPWIQNRYPLIELGMSRSDCLTWMQMKEYPKPPRSSCVFCPYHSDDEWIRLRDGAPDDFRRAVEWERQMQTANAQSDVARGVPFAHADRVPLDQARFVPGRNRGQFGNECEGMCGV
jgi:hypothetical protein